MIVASLLLILVAVVLLVLGLADGSSPLLVASIAASLLAAIALVIGARQTAGARGGADGYLDEDAREAASQRRLRRGAPPPGRSEVPDQRLGEDRTATSEAMTESIPVMTPAMMSGMAARDGAPPPTNGTVYGQAASLGRLEPVDVPEPMVLPDVPEPAEPLGYPDHPQRDLTGHEVVDHDTLGRDSLGRDTTGHETVGHDPELALDDEFADEFADDDPPDEPAPQAVPQAEAARVARMATEVLVIDGRPRYHLAGCVHLLGRESEPLPVGEAVELGFTPCSLCEPDSALLADARRV